MYNIHVQNKSHCHVGNGLLRSTKCNALCQWLSPPHFPVSGSPPASVAIPNTMLAFTHTHTNTHAFNARDRARALTIASTYTNSNITNKHNTPAYYSYPVSHSIHTNCVLIPNMYFNYFDININVNGICFYYHVHFSSLRILVCFALCTHRECVCLWVASVYGISVVARTDMSHEFVRWRQFSIMCLGSRLFATDGELFCVAQLMHPPKNVDRQ